MNYKYKQSVKDMLLEDNNKAIVEQFLHTYGQDIIGNLSKNQKRNSSSQSTANDSPDVNQSSNKNEIFIQLKEDPIKMRLLTKLFYYENSSAKIETIEKLENCLGKRKKIDQITDNLIYNLNEKAIKIYQGRLNELEELEKEVEEGKKDLSEEFDSSEDILN